VLGFSFGKFPLLFGFIIDLGMNFKAKKVVSEDFDILMAVRESY
jgi:hypothetical protein